MKEFTTVIRRFFDDENLHYMTKDAEEYTDTIIGFRMEDGSAIRVHVLVNDDKTVTMGVNPLIHVPDEKLAAVMIKANEDNRNQFFRLCVDTDQDLTMCYDFPGGLTEESLIACLKEMFQLFILAIDEYYAEYAQLIYSNNDKKATA